MSDHDEIILSISMISILSLATINELLHEWIIPALILIPVSAFIVGSWLLRSSRHKSLERYLDQQQQKEDHPDE